MGDNPYQAPEAALDAGAPRPTRDPGALQEARRVAAGRGWAWIREAYGLFKRRPVTWIGIVLAFYVINLLLSLVPIVNLASALLFLVLAGGIYFAAMRTETRGEAALGDLFRGFRQGLGWLLVAGAFYLLGSLLAAGVNFAIAGQLGFGSQMVQVYLGTLDPGSAQLPPRFWAVFLTSSWAVMLPFVMAVFFAPALIVLNGTAPGLALRMSFMGCLRNILPMLVYGLAAMALFVLGALPLLLGLLVVLPVLFLSAYTAFRDIFYPAPA